jgi:hypothetical protein
MPGVSFRLSRVAGLSLGLGTLLVSMLTTPSPILAHAEHGHPSAIHEGTCEQLGRLVFRLNGVGGSVDVDNAPVATPTTVNPTGAYQVMVSQTTIDGALDDLLAGEHAVMVYESDEEMTAISCGNVGGAQSGDTLITGLAEMGVPGHSGFAIFRSEGDQTSVEVLIGHGLAPVSSAGKASDADHDDAHDEANDEEHADDVSNAAATPAP